MDIIKIDLLSPVCVGNGESVGNSIDTDVCMDAAGLPEYPSRRIKGCLKQAALDLKTMLYKEEETEQIKHFEENISRLFGDVYGQEGCLSIQNATIEGAGAIRSYLQKGIPANVRPDFVSELEIPDAVKKAARSSNVEKMFSHVIGQTRLENGVKVDNSLRFTRVVDQYNPFEVEHATVMSFYAPVFLDTEDQELIELFEMCCKATRHMGTNRNRGLGNVKISWIKNTKQDVNPVDVVDANFAADNEVSDKIESQLVKIDYKIALNAPVTLPGCDELNTSIPSRSVIGCMAGFYIHKYGKADDLFSRLFLNGDVMWSALTPVVNGVISHSVPMLLMKLKNDHGRLINAFTEKSDGWKSKKPKTLDGSFASVMADPEGTKYWSIVTPEIHTVYHNSINAVTVGDNQNSGRNLYMQDSIDADMVYGGSVICPVDMKDSIMDCLSNASLRFGRSKNAQYAACSLYGQPKVEPYNIKSLSSKDGEKIYVVLKSDLACSDKGIYITDNAYIRNIIATKLSVRNMLPVDCNDMCRYHTLGGFQTTWQLQKQQVPVIRAGSVYCFISSGTTLPEEIQIGDFRQEGLGVCEVFTQSKLDELKDVKKAKIDRISYIQDNKLIKKVYTKILINAGLESMKEYALEFSANNNMDKLPLGRLRLMLSEAKNYDDFIALIGSMKESDVNSENEGRKKTSESFIKKFYEEESIFSLKKLLSFTKGLWEEISMDPNAVQFLEKNWKKPMEIALHSKHYQG